MVKGNLLLDEQKVNFNKARLKKGGENFEIVIEVEPAIRYKEGAEVTISEILRDEHIFADANKGELASETHMNSVFGTKDPLKVAKIILDEGEIQITSEIREREREKKRNKIITMISTEAIDPTTKLPHPAERIKLAMAEAKVSIDMFKTVEQQFDNVVSRLKPIIPLSFQKKILYFKVPAQYAGKAQAIVRRDGTIQEENWGSDGAWEVTIQLSPGIADNIVNQLNSLTHGAVKIEEK
ncbi:ribosome assembly factor SBDS [Candidatus Woesearchaeota archaeon]|nr:ribosome assembly factor SBDS [Candidatus Woesearchaeota archaeon]